MSDDLAGRKILQQTVDAYVDDRKKQFVLGFVRFVLERGLKTLAPQRQGKPPETWRDTGRRLYGTELFEATLAAEVEARRQAHAERPVPSIRGNKVQDAERGQAVGGSRDQRS